MFYRNFIAVHVRCYLESIAYISVSVQTSQSAFSEVNSQLSCLGISLQATPVPQLLSFCILLFLDDFSQLLSLLLQLQDLALVVQLRCLLTTCHFLRQIRQMIAEAHSAWIGSSSRVT